MKVEPLCEADGEDSRSHAKPRDGNWRIAGGERIRDVGFLAGLQFMPIDRRARKLRAATVPLASWPHADGRTGKLANTKASGSRTEIATCVPG